MSATPGKKRKIIIGAIIWPIIILIAIPFFGFGAGSCMGFGQPALERLRGCPRAVELLGEPVNQSFFGLSCGNAETSGGFGQASWRMPVAGSKARGTYSFNAERRGGPWQFHTATLEVGDETVNVLSCSSVGGSGAISPQAFVGTVTTVTGPAPVAQGAQCTLSVMPATGAPFNCRLNVACGGQVIYGSGSGGYTDCNVSPGPNGTQAITALDGSNSNQDNDPAVDVRTAEGRVTVSDATNAGLWLVTIQLPIAAPPAPAVPAPTPAPAPTGAAPVQPGAAPTPQQAPTPNATP